MQKRRSKNGRHSEKSSGLNLNPLAPAQSKRTFSFSGKTRIFTGNAFIPAPFFSPFLYLFRTFCRKSQKGSRVRPQSRKKTPKCTPRGPTGSPRINKLSLKVPPSTKNTLHFPPRVAKWSPKAPQSARKIQRGPQKC